MVLATIQLEKICDRVALIDKGRIVDIIDMNEIRNRPVVDYKIEFLDPEDYEKFKKLKYQVIRDQKKYNQVTVRIEKEKAKTLFKDLTKFKVKFISEVKYNLEKKFNEILHSEDANA